MKLKLATALIACVIIYSPVLAENRFEKFDKSKFSNSTKIDNMYMPLIPGKQFVYEGYTGDGTEKKEHRVVFTVTNLVKKIDGVLCVVIWDQDIQEGRLEESELTFFAQDDDGNVWHLGQHREIHDEVEFVGGRTWLVGHLDGAKAGIMMKANPQVGTKDYSQGFAPAPFNWTDRAKTKEIGVDNEVPFGKFQNVLVTEEYNDEEPGAIQLKYYAPHLGVIRVGWSGDDDNKEVLELVEVKDLSEAEMRHAVEEARKIETRAYIYGTTPKAVKPN